MIMFGNLKPEHFELVSECATKYRVTDAGKQVLHSSFVNDEDGGCLNYFNFLKALLAELERFLKEGILPDGMTATTDFKMCENCGGQDKTDFDRLRHCSDCFPGVTFTKAGPCLILNYKTTHRGQETSIMVSIDLIPLLPCPEKNPIPIHRLVTHCLIKGDLPNWQPYLKKFVWTDCLLPETLSSPKLPIDGYIALKLLHVESDTDNFILRPGQTMAMENLEHEKVKLAYCFLKALRTTMGVNLSSYQLKKIILLRDLTCQAQTVPDVIRLVFVALNHPHLKAVFQGHKFKNRHDPHSIQFVIDYAKWQSELDKYTSKRTKDGSYYWIPLTVKEKGRSLISLWKYRFQYGY